MSITVTNRVASKANQGHSVKVTLNQADTATYLKNIVAGQKATNNTSGLIGYVKRVDTLGNSFTIMPQYPFSSIQTANTVLAVGETITIG